MNEVPLWWNQLEVEATIPIHRNPELPESWIIRQDYPGTTKGIGVTSAGALVFWDGFVSRDITLQQSAILAAALVIQSAWTGNADESFDPETRMEWFRNVQGSIRR